MHRLIKKYFIGRNFSHHLSLQGIVIFLLAEGFEYDGCLLIRVVVAKGWVAVPFLKIRTQ